MESILVHTYEIPVKGVKKKILYHFSDLHLTQYDEMSDKAEIEEAKAQTALWDQQRKSFADKSGEQCTKAQMQSPVNHFENLIKASSDGDVLLLAGDIMDYINGANVRCVDAMLGKISVPYLYVPGNHEAVEKLPDSEVFKRVKKPVQIIEMDDMIILGLDDSKREITAEQNEIIEKTLKIGKPIIILMHVPIMTSGNEEQLRECGEYFYINYEGAPEENYRFINIIKDNADKIIAVFTGHLHFKNMSEITPNVTQYVSSQGIVGNLNRYIIGC